MTTTLTAEEAIELLRKNPNDYATKEALRDLAAQVDANAKGQLTVLYSGPAANGVWSTQVIDAMVEAGENVRVINKSEAAKFLTSDDFYHALANAYGLDDFRPLADGSYRGPATAWLYHPEHGPWADASGRFADATKGEVVAIVGDADPGRVFGKVEVPRILANPSVTTVEGIPRETLAAMSKPGDTQAAFEMIVARAREHGGRLRVAVPDAVNYRNQLLYDESGTLRVDSREYFEGTGIEGRSPAIEGETRALSRNMNSPTAHATAGQSRLEAWQHEMFLAQQASESHHSRMGGVKLGLTVEAGLIAYEWNDTRKRAQVFQDTLHNDTAAVDAYVRQGAQTGGALVGTAVGGVTATAVGAGTGGTAALVMVEGYLFGKAAEHGVEVWQARRVYNIESEGVKWTFNGKDWTRGDLRADFVADGVDQPQEQRFFAQPDKARELSARASYEAVQQALEDVPTPRNPFVQPVSESDPAHFQTMRWTYSADSGRWSRMVADSADREGAPEWNAEPEYASAERAAQLSAQALRTIDANLRAGPAEIAAQYQQGHKAYGYDQTPFGAMPEAVATALSPDLLQASDSKHYRRDAQGEWTHEGKVADPSRALELEVTRDRLLPALQDHQQRLSQMPPWQPPTPEETDRAMLRRQYVDHGWNPEVRQDEFEARYLAVQRTREAHGLPLYGTTLVLEKDAYGQADLNSPILHTRLGPNNEVERVATTTPEDIAKALADVHARGRGDGTPQPSSLERTIAPATPEERDAREQAQREANRQGLSHDDAQQVVHAAVVSASARGIAPAGGAARAAEETQENTPQRERVQDVPTASDVPLATVAAGAMTRDARDEDARAERERADIEQQRQAERTARDQAQPDGAHTIDATRPPISSTAERDRDPPPPTHTTAAESEARTATEDRPPSPPSVETAREPSPSPAVVTPAERESSPEPERNAAKIETTATPERPSETPTHIPADREPQEARVVAAPASVSPDPNALRLGDRSDDVELLQYRLDRQGYRGPDGAQIPQTGQYGPDTEHAVKQFQTMHGLPATGVADQDTREAVDRALAAQRERERAEQGDPNRSPPASTPTRETPEPVAAARTVGLSASSAARSADAAPEREEARATRAEAQPAMPATATPDPALAHRTATRDERDDERRASADPDRAQTTAPEQVRAAPPLMTEPTHAAHGMYQRAQHVLSQIEVAPGMGGLTQHERQTLGASVVAMSLSAEGWKFTGFDHVVPGKTDPQTGRPEAIFVVQGALDNPAHQRIAINVDQALSQSIEQSSAVSQSVMQAREQAMAQQQAQAEQLGQDGPQGPTMRIGPRTLSPSQGPQGDGGGGDGGGGGGGGGGG
ncbi:MAG: peptidoglycan-binding protein [Pseudomonadota bacterium]